MSLHVPVGRLRQDHMASSSGKRHFTFIQFNDPSQSQEAATRRRVRSNAAQDSWKMRHRTREEAGRLQWYEDGPEDLAYPGKTVSPAFLQYRPNRSIESPGGSDHYGIPTDVYMQDTTDSNPEDSTDASHLVKRRNNVHTLGLDSNHNGREPLKITKIKRKRSFDGARRTPVPSLTQLKVGSSQGDPFDAYPVDNPKPWFGWCLDYRAIPLALKIRSKVLLTFPCVDFNVWWPRGFVPLGLSWAEGQAVVNATYELTIEDASSFYMTLYMATSCLGREGRIPKIDALWLRGKAIRAICEALNDTKRSTSDALIYTLCMIVTHEIAYGDAAAAVNIHKPALSRILELTGGPEKWGVSEVLKQQFNWFDGVVCARTGAPRSFCCSPSQRFTKQKSAAAASAWLPEWTHRLSPALLNSPGVDGPDVFLGCERRS